MQEADTTYNQQRSVVSTCKQPLHTVAARQSSWDSTSWAGTDHKTGAEGDLHKRVEQGEHTK